jgi:hypothetical protein
MHYAAGRVATAGARPTVFRECLLLGALLPDIPAKAADSLLELEWAASVSHTPLLWAPLAYLVAHLFAERLRPSAFWGLLLGGWIHILVDVAKDNMGFGILMLGFPFSWRTFALGLYYPENSLAQAPWCLGAVLLVEWFTRRREKASARTGSGNP